MKTFLKHTNSVLFPLILALLMAGCASSGLGGAYTLKMTQTNVSWKMEAYQQGLTGGLVTTGEQQQITAAYQVFQEAFQKALAAANGDLDSPSPSNVMQQANQLINLIDSSL